MFGEVKPAEVEDPRQVGRVIHQTLRDYILHGVLEPGTVLDQVSLAQRLQVSRTPIREVIRMLKEEGLVTADLNQRAQVAGISYEELDALYAIRIANESLALAMSIQQNSDEDIARVQRALKVLGSVNPAELHTWVKPHRDFHLALYERAGDAMTKLIRPNIEKCERFQSIRWRQKAPRDHSADGGIEHVEIFNCCVSRDVVAGVELLSAHLARTALDTLNDLAPEREPQFIRRALRFASAGAVGFVPA